MSGKCIMCLVFLMLINIGQTRRIRSPTNLELSLSNVDFYTNDKDAREYALSDTKPVSSFEHRRHQRSSQHPNCGQWSPWVNRHTPTSTDKGDSEIYTQSEIESFCPYAVGGSATNFECADEKGEPFSGILTSVNGHFRLDCNDITVGAKCTVLVSTLDKCPDLKMRYKCTCGVPPVITTTTQPTTVVMTTASPTVPKVQTQTTWNKTRPLNSLSIGGIETEVQTVNVCGLSIKWWIFDLAVSIFLFLVNITVSIILYKKAVRLITQRRNDRIHPAHKNIMF